MSSVHPNRLPRTILAIESAISGGSLAILRGSDFLGSVDADSSISRAEDLLLNIRDLVSSTVGSTSEVDSIAVSIGPGSFTGLRIGISTARGLGKALEIKCSGVSLFDAMATLSMEGKLVLTVVPMGKRDVCFQLYQRNEKAYGVRIQARTVPLSGLAATISEFQPSSIVFHGGLESSIHPVSAIEMIDAGPNMAEIIGRYAMNSPIKQNLAPIYVQSPRFA